MIRKAYVLLLLLVLKRLLLLRTKWRNSFFAKISSLEARC